MPSEPKSTLRVYRHGKRSFEIEHVAKGSPEHLDDGVAPGFWVRERTYVDREGQHYSPVDGGPFKTLAEAKRAAQAS